MLTTYGKTICAVLVLVALITISGCGDDDSDDSGGSSSAPQGYLETVQADVDKWLSPQGTYVEKPTTSPTSPGEKKKIAVIGFGQQAAASSQSTAAAREAADSLGWETTLFDAKFDFPSASTGIRNALAQGADGIFMYAIDCQYVKAALQEAKDAGVPVVAAESRDCSSTNPGAPDLFTHVVEYVDGDFQQLLDATYQASVDYAVAEFKGQSKALALIDDVGYGDAAKVSIEKAYAKCKGCTLDVVRFPVSAYGTRLQGIAEQALLKHPDVNTVIPLFEAPALEIYPAVRSSGRADQILTLVGEGGEAGLDLIRDGARGYAYCLPVQWEGYAGIDALGRIFAGEEPVPTGIGIQLTDAEHNLPKSGPCVSPIDFKAMYQKAWGVD